MLVSEPEPGLHFLILLCSGCFCTSLLVSGVLTPAGHYLRLHITPLSDVKALNLKYFYTVDEDLGLSANFTHLLFLLWKGFVQQRDPKSEAENISVALWWCAVCLRSA